MYIARVFNQLSYNTDRNLGNLLIAKVWKIGMIDPTRAFRTRTTILSPKNLVRGDTALLAAMKRLDEKGLLKRRDLIIACFEKAPPQAIYASERRR